MAYGSDGYVLSRSKLHIINRTEDNKIKLIIRHLSFYLYSTFTFFIILLFFNGKSVRYRVCTEFSNIHELWNCA